jgi:SAM-dependent methyltransferase
MNVRVYTFDENKRIYRTPEHDSIAYSDGEEVEHRLLAALRQCRDLSSTSDELRRHIIDWPSEYHLSAFRHVLLRPFAISSTDRILELGCGCGAITRYLGETGATIVGVEGSQLRAQIAAQRCRDLPNVRIFCDNIVDFVSAEHFDLVTLIGVLEYAPSFIDHPDPAAECLSRAGSHLGASGRLILAIENKLGLKYFSGCGEDHTGDPFLGIEGLYPRRGAITFGRSELKILLNRAGFTELHWFYPFPDYKLPRIIVSETAIQGRDIDIATLLARSCSRDYYDNPLRCFDEILARRAVWQNGLLGEMANSFLVIAGQNKLTIQDFDFLAKGFNLSRRSVFCTETTFARDTQRQVIVTRNSIPSIAPTTQIPDRFKHQLLAERYVSGRLLVEQLHELARTDWSISALAAWAAPWVAELQRRSCADDPTRLPAHFVDFTPYNAVQTATGVIAYIDPEWCAVETIPLTWVFIRGLAHSFSNIMRPARDTVSRRILIMEIATRLELPLCSSDFVIAEDWETSLQHQACGGNDEFVLKTFLDLPIGEYLPILAVLHENRVAVATALDSLDKTLRSRSWRFTRPLRCAHGLLSSIGGTSSRK